MPTSPPRRRPRRSADDTRAELLEITIAMIDESGVVSLRVAEVCRRAGVVAPTLYRLFPTREDLLAEALAEMWDRAVRPSIEEARQAVLAMGASTPTPAELAAQLVLPRDPRAERNRWRRVQILAAAAEIPSLRERVAERQRQLTAEIDALLEAVIARDPSAMPVVPVRVFRFALIAMYIGYVLDDLEEEPLTDAQMIEFFTEFITRFRVG